MFDLAHVSHRKAGTGLAVCKKQLGAWREAYVASCPATIEFTKGVLSSVQRFSLDIRKERLIRTGEARAAAAASDGRIQRPAAPKPAPLATAAPSPLAAVRGPTVPLVRTTAAPVTQAQRVAPAQQQPRACAPPAAQQGLPQQQWAPDLQRLLAQQQGPPAQPEPSQGASAQQQGALEAPAQQGMPAQQQQQQLAAEQRRKQQLQLHQITMMKRQLMRARLEVLPPDAW